VGSFSSLNFSIRLPALHRSNVSSGRNKVPRGFVIERTFDAVAPNCTSSEEMERLAVEGVLEIRQGAKPAAGAVKSMEAEMRRMDNFIVQCCEYVAEERTTTVEFNVRGKVSKFCFYVSCDPIGLASKDCTITKNAYVDGECSIDEGTRYDVSVLCDTAGSFVDTS
jgi:hypothetical protein